MQACIIDDEIRFVFGHAFVYVPNYKLLKIAVGNGKTKECIQMLPIVGKQVTHGIAKLFGDGPLVAVRKPLEGAIHAIPVF